MAPLPTEVLYLIFPQLVQRDQLECMTVCRQWNDIIQEYTLFRFIYIDHQEQLDQLIERVKRDPFLGTKVERLTMRFELESDYDAEIMIENFPNLREFALMNTNPHSGYKSITPRQNHPWCQSMEMIADVSDRNVETLLRSGLCKHLTYIAMGGHEEELGRSIIEALVNAPVLKTLEMTQYTLSFKDLEALHKALPLLESLTLYSISFNSLSVPYNIKPATSIKVFRCTGLFCYASRRLNPHLLYIGKKYTHLEELSLELLRYSYESDEDQDEDEDEDDEDDENEGFFEIDVVDSHRARFVSYMTTLAPRLKTLSLSTIMDETFQSPNFGFKILDECGCKIRRLTMEHWLTVSEITNLESTMQAHNIQSLTLAANTNLEFILRALGSGHFTGLKELTLNAAVNWNFTPWTIMNLSAFLTNVKDYRLEALRINGSKLEIDNNNKTITAYASLKELILDNVTFPRDIDAFISRAFPNLKRLKLGSTFMTPVTFQFPNLDFSYLKIVNGNAIRDSSVMVITLNDNQQRLYRSSTKKYFKRNRESETEKMFPSPFVSSKPFDKLVDMPLITIVCKSVFNFTMLGFEKNEFVLYPFLPQT